VSDTAITITGLAKAFSAIVALDDVDLDRRAAALGLGSPDAFGRKHPHISGAAPPRCLISPSAQLCHLRR
jgi:hypothetical protein